MSKGKYLFQVPPLTKSSIKSGMRLFTAHLTQIQSGIMSNILDYKNPVCKLTISKLESEYLIIIFKLNKMNNSNDPDPGKINQHQLDEELLEESIIDNYIFKHEQCTLLTMTPRAPSSPFIPL